MTTKTTALRQARADEVAVACEDAYSADRFTSWPGVAKTLLGMGYNAEQAEAIMRSKYTRWAADMSDKPYGKVPAKAIKDFADKNPSLFTPAAISGLVDGSL